MTTNITKNQLDRIETIQQEIVKCFNNWDGAIKNRQQAVAIQDLEYWQGSLAQVIREIKRKQVPLEIQKLKYGTLEEQKQYDQWLIERQEVTRINTL